MSYEVLEQKILQVPELYLDKVADFIDTIIRQAALEVKKNERHKMLHSVFGILNEEEAAAVDESIKNGISI